MNDKRQELLLKMYDQMFNDIDRHILVVWQSVGVLIGAFAIFALVETNVISLDIAASIILLLCVWLIAHLYDAGYWYNRNLVIIANIERQFLKSEDLKSIHYYFGKHRPNNHMITHLKIQYALGIGLGGIVLLYHFFVRVFPGVDESWRNFEFLRTLPYVFTVVAFVYLARLRKHRDNSYQEFIANSPGIAVDTSGISYGAGHGFEDKNDKES